MALKYRFSLVSLFALGIAMPAMAQQAPVPQPAEDAGPQADRRDRDVVVVTAQKREESVQDIAVAVTAISSELRDEIGLTSVQDYTNFAPGLSYSTSNDRLGLRGVTRTSNNFGIRSGISNYVDGVYFSSASPAGREPIFVERVEVLRGPQGTLYGRDSIGGALNLISKRPSEEFEGQFNLGYGNFEASKVEARVAGPITDWLRYSLAGSRSAQNEGNLTNASGQESEGYRTDGYYLEAQLEGNVGDRFDWWAKYSRLAWDKVGAPGARTSVGDRQPYDTRLFTPGSFFINPFFAFSGVATNVNQVGNQRTNPAITDPLKFNTDYTEVAHLEPTNDFALEAVYHFDNFDVKYLGGSAYYHYTLNLDTDNSPVKSFRFNNRDFQTDRVTDYNENRGWYSNEINLISTGDGPFQWVTGAYQYQENYTQPIYASGAVPVGGPIVTLASAQQFVGALAPPAFGGLGLLLPNLLVTRPDLPDFTGRNIASGSQIGGDLFAFTNNQAVNNAYGLFVQGDYAFNDEWKVTAGVRWSKDTTDGREYARLISIYSLEAQLENALGPAAAPLLASFIPPRIDLTAALGGPDPTTVTATNPCGLAGVGIQNAKPTAANGVAGVCGGPNDRSRYGIYIDPLTGNAFRDIGASWSEVTGVLGLDWTPDADTLIYAKYNRGYKPGGIGSANTNGNLVATPYTDQELVNAYELGLKREWEPLNLTTNAVVFYYDYEGYQVSNAVVPEDPDGTGPLVRPPAFTSYVNLPETVTTGFELETIWTPTDNFRLLVNYGYTNPEIGSSPSLVHNLDPFARDPAAQPQGAPVALSAAVAAACLAAPATAINCFPIQGQSLDGNILPFSPKNKAAAIATYSWFLENGSTIDATASYFWQDIAFSSVFNRSYTKIPSWDQTDARLVWTNADENITLIGFVRNVFDEIAYDSRGSGLREGNNRAVGAQTCGTTAATTVSHAVNPLGTLGQSCLTTTETYRPPRTYGVELQFRF